MAIPVEVILVTTQLEVVRNISFKHIFADI